MPEEPKKNRTGLIITIVSVLAVVVVVFGGAYYYVSGKTIYIDQSIISAPLIGLSPSNAGVLQAVFVKDGDMVSANEPIARGGNEIVNTNTAGERVAENNNSGIVIIAT